jgi:hypothetical protein
MDRNHGNTAKSHVFSQYLIVALAVAMTVLPVAAHAQTQTATESSTPVTETRHDPVWNGAAIGLGVGAVMGLRETLKADEKTRCSPQPRCTLALMFGNAISLSLVGTAIDRVIPRRIDVHDGDWADDPRSDGAAIGAAVGLGIGIYVDRKSKWCGPKGTADSGVCHLLVGAAAMTIGAVAGFAIDSAIPTRTSIAGAQPARNRTFKIGFAFSDWRRPGR